MPRAWVNGVKLNYQQVGQGPDIVMLHGLAANLAFWYIKIVPFLTNSFRVTVFDLRGHGYSDMPLSGYTSADMQEDLHALLDQLGIRQAHLVGHSFGGVVALQFATLCPERVRSLTIADSRISALQPVPRLKEWPHWNIWKTELDRLGIILDDEQELDYQLLEKLANHQWQSAKQDFKDISFFVPFETWNRGRRGVQQWLRLLSTTTAKQDFEATAGLTLNSIQQLHHPTLAIYGEYSYCLPSCRELQKNLLHCKPVIVPRVGHFHPLIRPAIFLRNFRRFLLKSGY